MANNGFDSFGGFDDFDSFDNQSGGTFGGNDSFNSNFDLDTGVQPSSMGNFSMDNTGGGNTGGFTDSFSGDTSNQFVDAPEDTGELKKKSVVVIVVGVIATIVVILVATFFTGKTNTNNENTPNEQGQSSNISSESTDNNNANINVDDIMGDGNKPNSSEVVEDTSKVETEESKSDVDTFDWVLITDSEAIEFSEEYMECTFTVTSIEHIARPMDTNNNLVVVTRLQGSLSGMAGTYELFIPYNKGIKLVVGNRFTVFAQIGTYNNKTVVGEIKYY